MTAMLWGVPLSPTPTHHKNTVAKNVRLLDLSLSLSLLTHKHVNAKTHTNTHLTIVKEANRAETKGECKRRLEHGGGEVGQTRHNSTFEV